MKNYLVIGLGKFGITVAKTLYDAGNFVLAIDSDADKVQRVLDEGLVEEAIALDATDENGLLNVAKDSFDAAFVCIGSSVQSSILVTLMLKEMNLKKIICKATTKIQGKVLEKVGATQIVYAEEFMGEKIAYTVMHPSINEYFNFSDGYCIYDINIPKKFIGKSLKELNLRGKYLINVIAIKDNKGNLDITPSPEYTFKENDTLIVLGQNKTMGDMTD